jgi:hypothetical protein
LTRKIIDSVIANPITVVFGIVMVICVTVLFDRITSDDSNFGSNEGVTTPVSTPSVDRNVIQHEGNRPYYEGKVTNTGVNNASRFQSTSKNTNRSRNNSSNNPDYDGINSSEFNNTNNQVINSDGDVSTKVKFNQTNISFPAKFVDTSSSNFIDSTVDNTASSVLESDTNTPPDTSDPDETPDIDPPVPEVSCTATSEYTVQIDLDETQSISCCSIVANGPSCMCTLTTTDASGTVVEVMNNCGS